jgi:hypothetical protein
VKRYDDAIYVVEEIRSGRKTLAFIDMYKSSLTHPDEKLLKDQDLKFVDVKGGAQMLDAQHNAADKLHVRNGSVPPSSTRSIPQPKNKSQAFNKSKFQTKNLKYQNTSCCWIATSLTLLAMT